MASREERMQQRLRGSQRRQVKDVEFALVIPAAPASDPIPDPEPDPPNQQTPQLELPPLPSGRRTPATRSRAQPTPNGSVSQDGRVPVMRSGNVDANISAKRRKLNTDVEPPSSGSSRSRAAPHPDVYNLPEDEPQDPLIAGDSNVPDENEIAAREPELVPEPQLEPEPPVSQRRARTARTPSLPPQLAEEVTESPADAPGSGHRSRPVVANAVSASLHLQIVQNDSIVEIEAETPVRAKRKRAKTSPAPTSLKLSQEQDNIEELGASIDDMDELSPEQPVKRPRKRKVVVEQEPSIVEEDTNIPVEQEEAEAIDDLQAAAILEKNRGRRASARFQPEPSADLDDVGVRNASRSKRRKVQKSSTPVKQSHPKKLSKEAKKGPRKEGQTSSRGPPISVVVHRLTEQHLYDDDESDVDMLNSEIPYAKRGGVNAIDVLSGLCQEIVTSGLERIEEGRNVAEDRLLQREYATKWRALKSFGEELQARLREHTINLDNSYSLERRVREQQKKKLGLRDDILRVRAERQQIALRMDEIRIKHESEANKAQERDTLNTATYDIELAVERGKSSHPIVAADGSVKRSGLDVLLKGVAGEVSNKSDSGGVLKHIKDFNAFLERAASALESMKA
ncbi:hypothetical protein LSUE1_G001065 [Lachnellula suecica]|uniref:Inner kinetochore subunit AME1 domain-containing protein n=1 Tax=Lachnellula suecica TaxID=602035 RepID=A0A8T9CGX0_9HELO|nr:hypothetical protein LSUE1_G001065 [Lachnellula suecica]